jgi:hypothetical protein
MRLLAIPGIRVTFGHNSIEQDVILFNLILLRVRTSYQFNAPFSSLTCSHERNADHNAFSTPLSGADESQLLLGDDDNETAIRANVVTDRRIV